MSGVYKLDCHACGHTVNPQLRAEALAAAHQVANTHADLLRLALKDSGARRHNVAIPEARPLWAVGLNGRNGDRQ